MTRQRAFVVVTDSLPRFCAVCGGKRRAQLVRLGDMHGAGVVACPHCSNEHLPVLHLPFRADDITPKGVA